MPSLEKSLKLIIKADNKDATNALKQVESAGVKTFKSVMKEAAIMGGAIIAAFTGAWKILEQHIQKYTEWEASLSQISGALGLTKLQQDALNASLMALGKGELAKVPGYYENAAGAAKDYLESGGDIAHLQADLGATFKASAGYGLDWNTTLTSGLAVMDAWNLGAGNQARALGAIRAAQLATNKPFSQLQMGLAKSASLGQLYNFTIEESAALTAGWASSGERAASMASQIVIPMNDLGLKSFPDLLTVLKQVNEGTIDLSDYSTTTQRALAALGAQVGDVEAALSNMQAGVGDVDVAFDSFSRTTLAETTRRHNELAAAQLEAGERMKELQPEIENIKTQIQMTVMAIAVWVLKNPGYTAAIIAGIMAIRTAFQLMKASNPVGWIMLAIEAAVALIGVISELARSHNAVMLEATREAKRMLEEQKATIDQTRSEIKTRIDAAKATGEQTEALKELEKQYLDATLAALGMEKEIIALSKAEAFYAEQVALEEAAEEVFRGGMEIVIARRLKGLAEELQTQEDINRANEELLDLRTKVALAAAKHEPIEKVLYDYMLKQGIATKEQLDSYLEANISLEEAETFMKGIEASINRANAGIDAQKQGISLVVEELYAASGYYDDIREALITNKSLTSDEIKLLTDKLEAQKANIRAALEEARIRLMSMTNQQLGLEIYMDMLEKSREVTEQISRDIASIKGKLAGVDEDGDGDGDGDGAAREREQEQEESLGYLKEQYQLEDLLADAQRQADQQRLRELLDSERMMREAILLEEAMLKQQWDLEAVDRYRDDILAAWESIGYTREQAEVKLAKIQDEAYQRHAAQAQRIANALSGVVVGMTRTLLEDGAAAFGDKLKKFMLDAVWAFIQRLLAAKIFKMISGGPLGLLGDILGLEHGGVVTRPTLALIGEGGEREFVVPEPKLADFIGAQLRGRDWGGAPSVENTVNVAPTPVEVKVEVTGEGLLSTVRRAENVEQTRRGL